MSVLNNKNNAFVIWFPKNFFYPEVIKKWEPIIKKMNLQFQTIDDFLNFCIQSVTFPGLSFPQPEQGEGQYNIKWRGGKELEVISEKTLNISFKLSESFLSYWIVWDQLYYYLSYYGQKKPWWPSLNISFLNDAGFTMFTFKYNMITPSSLSELNLNYSSTVADFNTFSLGLTYNTYDFTSGNLGK